ncbi:response regulator [uncultured Methanoregula sp.]|uniref:response regulator n=1 Tax=uncultured Methanoregula sp. TaxID=1005933 RepID=UPI002AABFD4D|nr:response regulator [uncultured Methanoregula sp.]
MKQDHGIMITILLVDDQPDLLELTRIFLEKEGDLIVDTAVSAEEALRMLKAKKYDAVVSDYNMPEMDGIEFLDEFMKRAIDKPFIIFTGKSREDLVIRALNSGADFYLQKSTDPRSQYAELRNMVHQAVMRKRVEDALIRSEINHRNIVEAIEDSIYMVDKNSRYLFMNAYHQQRLGITDGNYIGRDYSEFHTPEECERFTCAVQESIESGKSVQDEYRSKGRWFIRRLSPVRNETLERIFAVTVISAETTGRKQVEEALQFTDENYQIVVEATQDSIYTVNPDGRYLFMNTHHKQRLGIDREKYYLRSYGDFHTPEENRIFSTSIRQVIQTKKSHEDTYTRNNRKFLRRMYPVFGSSKDNVTAISVISLEISPH